jgi:hypothetical protein
MTEWIEGIGRGQRGSARGPFGQIGEETRDAVKGIIDWDGRYRAFEALMIGRGGFFECQNFHSIVIGAPPHISESYRVFKKLMAEVRPDMRSIPREASARIYRLPHFESFLSDVIC